MSAIVDWSLASVVLTRRIVVLYVVSQCGTAKLLVRPSMLSVVSISVVVVAFVVGWVLLIRSVVSSSILSISARWEFLMGWHTSSSVRKMTIVAMVV